MDTLASKIVWPKPGTYVAAVSGGVDSTALLAMLVAHGGYELIVAHVDHGIRLDSGEDARLVKDLAQKYNLPFVTTELSLDQGASEEAARKGRYQFLFQQLEDQKAAAIITAHHADDMLETSIMNVRRGTDRYGAAGGMRRQDILRPLINLSKKELIEYAQQHDLVWREDSTNSDTQYSRNQIRHELIPHTDLADYQKQVTELQELNNKIDSNLKSLVSVSTGKLAIQRSHLNALSLRELEVLLAYGIQQADPAVELTQPKIAQLARHIMLDTTKNSFSLAGTTGIIVTIR